jgi:DNA helicase-2/ATP-dependent DNA helicase PcrA
VAGRVRARAATKSVPGGTDRGTERLHLLPRAGIRGQARFEGTIEDEQQLFYVAITRSQKYLHLTWAPITGKNDRYAAASDFWTDILASRYVRRRPPDYLTRKRLRPTPRAGIANVVFSFSGLKYFFECPYQFKLRILYGFNAPIHEALGYGQSLHDALAEYARAIRGDVADAGEGPRLIKAHLTRRTHTLECRLVGAGVHRRADMDTP